MSAMECLSDIEIIGVFISVGIGMASGPILAKIIDETLKRKSIVNRLRNEIETLRTERNTALMGSNHARMQLLDEVQDRGDLK
jgi:hypothetical protein